MFLSVILTLSGVALGALVVFRTKREPHESLFKPGGEKGEAFLLDDYGEPDGGRREARGERENSRDEDVVPGIFEKQHNRFMDQFLAGIKNPEVE